ncbi:MAG: AAA family ATPase [Acidobacteria bacterium]|nr:AAA family ATPase [Acidobacteriota bacterium]
MSGRVREAPGRQLALGSDAAQALFGINDENLRLLETELDVRISARDQKVFLEGEPEALDIAEKLIGDLGELASSGYAVDVAAIKTALRVAVEQPDESVRRFLQDTEIRTSKGRAIRPKGPNQKKYLEAIRKHDVVFAIGPAGTGKTFLAMAMAIEALNARLVSRIILARPAIEAGEKLGFLPGDMIEKVNPYLRPLYDALYSLVGFDRAGRLIDREQIEIAPLAFMRGRTLSEAFVILDEAQNTTPDQMKMFLTRLGMGSKAVLNGDVTQIDLGTSTRSGLVEASRILSGVDGIAQIKFDRRDVVRHELVKDIVRAYERHEQASTEDTKRDE